MPKIKCSLGNIQKAIDEIEKYKKQCTKNLEKLLQQLAENGAVIARAKLLDYGAIDIGNLFASVDYAMYREDNKAVIFTDSDHAAFVEFGTGVVGAYNPYPTDMPVGWSYASGEHIDPETGAWYFYNKTTGVSGWTQGMPSRPFMWDTANELRRNLETFAKGVFASHD